MKFIFFDDHKHKVFYPFTLTRPVAELRIGIMTIREKWEKKGLVCSGYLSSDWLAEKFFRPEEIEAGQLLINSRFMPDDALASELKMLANGISVFNAQNELVALKTEKSIPVSKDFSSFLFSEAETYMRLELTPQFHSLNKIWELFSRNGEQIQADFEALTAGRKSAPIPSSNRVIAPENVFIEPGAKVEMSIINASTGPVYMAADAEVMEGCLIRGPLAMCEHSALKMGAKIYGPTTLGPHCKVGGEVNNSVLMGYSNKGHDGFLGNSVIGEWCNLGADTNNSNLKNNYGEVKIWSMAENKNINTGLQFCGLFMGDHSKAGINTMFNTGTVAGVCANVFDGGFLPKYIPSFTWGGPEKTDKYDVDKAIETAIAMYSRRGVEFTKADENLLRFLSFFDEP
jgi:UDP-N-acetylglucosamine diphosphorylase/glucosamine-1-phosphate N-acetyltransferase